MKKETLYAYIRVSTDEQKLKDYSPARQKELAKKKADELGMHLEVFEEGGASASQEDFSNRPVFFSLLQLIQEGTAKHIFVFDQTRLSRNDTTKAVIVTNFQKAGVQLHTHSKRFDFNKEEDKLTFLILQAIEGYESALRKARFKLGYVSANKKGRFLGAMTPYGYKKDDKGYLIIDEEEKKVILLMVDLYLNKGYGTNQIANYLNEKGVKTKTDKVLKNGRKLAAGVDNRKKTTVIEAGKNRWNPGTINMLLQNEVLIGRRRFTTGKDTYEYVECPAILTREQFELIAAKRGTNQITKHKEDKYFYLLKGLLVCGNCGNALHGRVKPDKNEYTYRCNSKRDKTCSCKSRGINIDKLNTLVMNAFKGSLSYHEFILKATEKLNESPAAIQKQINSLNADLKQFSVEKTKAEKRLHQIVTDLSSALDAKTVTKFVTEITGKIKQIENNIATTGLNIKQLTDRLKKKSSNDESLKKEYLNFNDKVEQLFKANDEEARAIVNELIESIEVLWVEKTRIHEVYVKFKKQGNHTEGRSFMVKAEKPVKKIDLPPIMYGSLNTPPKVTQSNLRLFNKRGYSILLKMKTKTDLKHRPDVIEAEVLQY